MSRRFALLFSVGVLLVSVANAQEWGCYDPKPGHPTEDEKAQFVRTVSKLAVDAEREYGVPAPAIAAMAIVESGYGWTRTALEATNFFGWKYASEKAAEKRRRFVLACQPESDKNNQYVVFESAADTVSFVARKLATLPAYRADTIAYKNALAKGEKSDIAARRWLEGIANPYNMNPSVYVQTVTRVMNDAIAPSDTVSDARNLYRLTQSRLGTASKREVLANDPEAAKENTRTWFASTKSPAVCDATAIFDYPRWEGFPVRKCRYYESRVAATTYMLNPSAEQLSRWIVSACLDINAGDLGSCAHKLSKHIWRASNAIFPVAGFVPEPGTSGNAKGAAIRCFLFRDGVTVKTEKFPKLADTFGTECPEPDNDGPIVRAEKFARIASTTRQQYTVAGGTQEVGKDGDPRWADAIRMAYQEAWKSDRNHLIFATAKSLQTLKSN